MIMEMPMPLDGRQFSRQVFGHSGPKNRDRIENLLAMMMLGKAGCSPVGSERTGFPLSRE
jgi:hypothetical protein